MKTAVMAVLAVVVLSGCAKSITEMRAAGPERTVYSSHSVDEVSRCIVFAWQDVTWYGQHTEVSTLPSRGGGTTVFTSQNQFMADVDPENGKTRVRYYQEVESRISRNYSAGLSSCL